MEISLRTGTEAKLNDLARRTHRGAGELIEEAVEHLATYNRWLDPHVLLSASRPGSAVLPAQ